MVFPGKKVVTVVVPAYLLSGWGILWDQLLRVVAGV